MSRTENDLLVCEGDNMPFRLRCEALCRIPDKRPTSLVGEYESASENRKWGGETVMCMYKKSVVMGE